MFSRRTLICSATLLPGTLLSRAQAAKPRAPASQPGPLPATVKAFEAPYPTFGSIERLDPALDQLLPAEARIEKLAEGFDWIEGPVWVKQRQKQRNQSGGGGGYLLFSEIPLNAIYKWQESGPTPGVSVFMQPSGYHGDATDLKEPGTNGLVIDKRGRLIMCQHGDRRLARLGSLGAPQGRQIALAERFEGKRFNSPNDAVVHPSGDIFFTDPSYGLGRKIEDKDAAKKREEKERELPFQGVFRLDTRGRVHLVFDQMERPNGIGLSPDGRTLYVANSHNPRPIIMAFDLAADRSVTASRIFFNGAELIEKKPGLKGAFDGMAVDRAGNLFATGPGGILIITATGQHLGTIVTGVSTANTEFGGQDGKTLFITADMFLARVVTSTPGQGF